MPDFEKVTIVGVGLIGGSIGMAMRERGLARRVMGLGRREASLDTAVDVGAIDAGTTDTAEAVADADLVIVCTQVGHIAEHVRGCAELASPGTLLTDAGSTKSTLVDSLDAGLPNECRFVGGHPLAGREKTGAANAVADLFEGRLAILTPTENSRGEDVERLEKLWTALGSRVVRMTADEHDRVMAMTSHLPHAVAKVLAKTVPIEDLPFAGTGYGGTSRLGAGDPELWTQIFSLNKTYIVEALRAYETQLVALRERIESNAGDALLQYLIEAKTNRDALGS